MNNAVNKSDSTALMKNELQIMWHPKLGCACRVLGKPWKTLNRTAGLWADIWMHSCPNVNMNATHSFTMRLQHIMKWGIFDVWQWLQSNVGTALGSQPLLLFVNQCCINWWHFFNVNEKNNTMSWNVNSKKTTKETAWLICSLFNDTSTCDKNNGVKKQIHHGRVKRKHIHKQSQLKCMKILQTNDFGLISILLYTAVLPKSLHHVSDISVKWKH